MTTTIPTLIATVDQTKLIMEDQEMVPSTISVPVSMLVESTTKTLLDLIMVTTTTTPSSIAATTTETVPSTIKWSPTTTTFLPPIITQDSHQTTRYNAVEISTTISSLTTTTMSTSPSTTPPSTTTVASAFLLENLQESSTVNVSAVVDDNGEIGGGLSSLKNTFETIKDNLTDVYNNYKDVGEDIQNKTKQFLQNDGLKNLTDIGQGFIPGAMFKSNTANDGVDPQQQQQQVTVAYYALGIIFVALMLIIGFIAIYHYKLKKYFNGEPEDDRSVAQRTKRNPNDSNPNNNNNNTGSGNNNNNNNTNTNNGTDVKQQPLTKNLTAKVQDAIQGVGSAINTADQLAKTAKNKIEDVEAVVSKQLEKYEKKPEDGAQNKADTDTVVVQMDADKNPTKGNTVINPNNSNNSANAEPDSESDDEDPQIIQKRKRQTDKDRTDAAELNEL